MNRIVRALRNLRARLSPPRFFVATYGDYGLEVGFYRSQAEYDAAVAEAGEDHDMDRVDTFTHGEITA